MNNKKSIICLISAIIICAVVLSVAAPAFAGQKEDITRYCDMLMSKDDAQRATAVKELVKIGKPAVPSLIDALNKGQVYLMKQGAAEALGQILDSRAVPALVKALDDQNYAVKNASVIALGRIGDPSAAPAVIEFMKKNSVYLKTTGAGVLGQLKNKKAVPYLQELAEDPDPALSRAAKDALKKLK